jgi:hypothetical protein
VIKSRTVTQGWLRSAHAQEIGYVLHMRGKLVTFCTCAGNCLRSARAREIGYVLHMRGKFNSYNKEIYHHTGLQTMGVQTFYGKGPDPLLWAGLRAASDKVVCLAT